MEKSFINEKLKEVKTHRREETKDLRWVSISFLVFPVERVPIASKGKHRRDSLQECILPGNLISTVHMSQAWRDLGMETYSHSYATFTPSKARGISASVCIQSADMFHKMIGKDQKNACIKTIPVQLSNRWIKVTNIAQEMWKQLLIFPSVFFPFLLPKPLALLIKFLTLST